MPVVLWRLAGWPFPSSLPRWSAVGHGFGESEIGDVVLVKAAAGVCWIAWAALTVGVLVEAVARIGGRTARRLPFVGPFQVWGGRLVASALLLLSSFGATVRTAGAVPHVVRAPVAAAPAPSSDQHQRGPARQYVVRPPEGRRRDTLWGIAERHLGNPRRWPEIFELNRGRLSAGHRLTDPHWIYPGEVLLMPDDAVGVDGPQEARPAPVAPPVPAVAPAPELPTARHEAGDGSFVPPARHEPVPPSATSSDGGPFTMGHGIDSP